MKAHVLFEAFVEIEVKDLLPRDSDLLEKAYIESFEGWLGNVRGRVRTVSIDVDLVGVKP